MKVRLFIWKYCLDLAFLVRVLDLALQCIKQAVHSMLIVYISYIVLYTGLSHTKQWFWNFLQRIFIRYAWVWRIGVSFWWLRRDFTCKHDVYLFSWGESAFDFVFRDLLLSLLWMQLLSQLVGFSTFVIVIVAGTWTVVVEYTLKMQAVLDWASEWVKE